MFSKAKRFDPKSELNKNQTKDAKKNETEKPKLIPKTPVVPNKPKTTPLKSNIDSLSQCSSTKSFKSFVTPKPIKPTITKVHSSIKKPQLVQNKKVYSNKKDAEVLDDIIKAQEVEIRNKDLSILEYSKLIEDLKNNISSLQNQMAGLTKDNKPKVLESTQDHKDSIDYALLADELKLTIVELEQQCNKLEEELSGKQVELSSLEEVITIRDSLCKDLQEKLTNMENNLAETRQRLEMVKGHHALALEANESIRREYKSEIETLKAKLEEEKLAIIAKSKSDQENLKAKYNAVIESIRNELVKEKDVAVQELKDKLLSKEIEMKAKLDQVDEATHEKLRLCEIQFEERSQNLQEHLSQQQEKMQYLENEAKELKYKLCMSEDQGIILQKEINKLKDENEFLYIEKSELADQVDELKEQAKIKLIDFENEINKLTATVDKVMKDKSKFELSLSITRDIVHVLTVRLRESDNEVENLESKVQTLTNIKEGLEDELATYKNTLSDALKECTEYKDALVNILKSKAALAKEHTRIMEHNVSLIESLENVEKEAYRELGSIKSELIEDVELLKQESNYQIQKLRDEVEEKKMLCSLAKEQAGQAVAAAESSRSLLARAASDIERLDADNQRLLRQIQDQQSLVVELSLLRQENEELTMTVAKQSSIIEKMKKDAEIIQSIPKSPSVTRKTNKIGKENMQTIISPLRERNH